MAIGASPNGAARTPRPRHGRRRRLEQVLHEERRAQERELERRALDALLAAPVGRRGRRGAVRPERGRAAGHLDDPAHAGRRGRVDRRCLEEVLVGHVRREQQEPLDAVAALPAACRDAEGRRGRPRSAGRRGRGRGRAREPGRRRRPARRRRGGRRARSLRGRRSSRRPRDLHPRGSTRRPRRRRRRRRTRSGPAAAAPTSARADGATPRRRPGRRPAGRAPAAARRPRSSTATAAQPDPSRSSRRSVWGKSEPTVRRHGSLAGRSANAPAPYAGSGLTFSASIRWTGVPSIAFRKPSRARDPARRRRLDESTDDAGQALHAGDMRPPLLLVGVEQALVRAAEDGGELPREVGRVPRAAREPLAGERRHQVGRVAGEQDPAAAPRGRPSACGTCRRPRARSRRARRRAIRSTARRTAAGLEVRCGVLARVQHPLPAVAAGRHRQRDHRPRWRGRRSAAAGPAQRAVDERVDDDPALGRGAPFERDLKSRPHRAARAVAADEEAPGDPLRAPAVGRAHVGVDAGRAAVERLQRQAAPDVDGRALARARRASCAPSRAG